MIEPRRTDWIMTASGRPFWPLEPRAEDVVIEDIAHHLSNLCRFTGAVRKFYSVAQHCVLASRCFADLVREAGGSRLEVVVAGLYGLGHDGSEAYLIDLPRPLKHAGPFGFYRQTESVVQAVVYEAFQLPPEEPALLKVVDRRLLRTEQRDLMPPACLNERRDDVEPYGWTITPQSPEIARLAFMSRFRSLDAARTTVLKGGVA